jgi:hypothetical protein
MVGNKQFFRYWNRPSFESQVLDIIKKSDKNIKELRSFRELIIEKKEELFNTNSTQTLKPNTSISQDNLDMEKEKILPQEGKEDIILSTEQKQNKQTRSKKKKNDRPKHRKIKKQTRTA